MPLRKQLEFAFERSTITVAASLWGALRFAPAFGRRGNLRRGKQRNGYKNDVDLETRARELLQSLGVPRLAGQIRVEWNSRLKTCAGRADYHAKLIWLNPRLRDHGIDEIDRTLRHELAHLLAAFRAGRRRILPHGAEWRTACRDLGISNEARCHNLPFPISERVRRYVYKCPNCLRDFPRVRRIRRAVACLACCRAHNRGRFAAKFRLQLLERSVTTSLSRGLR
jgi:SprT protein